MLIAHKQRVDVVDECVAVIAVLPIKIAKSGSKDALGAVIAPLEPFEVAITNRLRLPSGECKSATASSDVEQEQSPGHAEAIQVF
jgi:hypothetical protein